MKELRSQRSEISRTAWRPGQLFRRLRLTSDLRPLTSGARVRRAGFTLVELMTVIAIIAILAGLILGVSGYATRKADRSKAIAEVEKLRDAIEEYRIKCGKVPDYPSDTAVTTFASSLSNNVPSELSSELRYKDPWDNSYMYRREGQFQYRLWSKGPDTLDAGDDIESEAGGL